MLLGLLDGGTLDGGRRMTPPSGWDGCCCCGGSAPDTLVGLVVLVWVMVPRMSRDRGSPDGLGEVKLETESTNQVRWAPHPGY